MNNNNNNTNNYENDENMEEIPNINSTYTSEEYYEEFLHFLQESDDMKKTAKNALRQGAYAGGGAICGAVALGPVGGAIGGVVGSVVGYKKSEKYDGVVQGIMKLDGDKRKVVLKEVMNVLKSSGATTQQVSTSKGFSETLFEFADNKIVRDQIWKIMKR